WKEQIAQCVQELERKTTLMGSLEHEVSILHRQVTEKEGESKELKRLIIGESEKSKKLEERLRVLQTEMATAASRAAERCSLMKVEVQRCQEEMEKQRLTIEALKRDRQGQSEREEELRQEVKVSQEKYLQKEQLLAALRQELLNAQTLAGELPALKKLCHELQAERTALEKRHRQEAEEQTRALEVLQGQLERLQVETAEVRSLRERSSEQERTVQRLQAEAAEQASRLAALRQSNVRLLEEKRRLEENLQQKKLEVELKESEERHSEEMEKLRAATEELVATSRREATEKVEEMRKEYESGKTAALEEKKKMVEEKQKLEAQVEQLETFRKDHVKQVEELQKALTQHEKDTRTQRQKIQALEVELKAEATRHHQKVSELQALLLQKEQTVEHYRGQMEKAKTHYEAKKQQNEDLVEQLKAMEQLQKDNEELRVEAQRLAKELQRSVLRAEEAERRCPRRGGPRPTPPAQMDFAKLRDLADFQGFTDPSENRDISHRNVGELSSDSLELSLEETEPLNSTRKPLRSHSETSAVPSGTKETQRLPRKVESLESLCFTPIPSRSRSRLESGVGKDLSVDSGCKTRSGQRRTTINITMSASLAPPPRAAPAKSRLRSAASTHFPSRESLGKMETSSPQDNSNDSTLRRLPGYRPLTRSSVRRQHGGSAGDGRSSIFMASCQDEPEPLDDWNRIAELQQRNRSCPPHLKTCYPLEIRPSDSLGTITDEEMKTGDPKETLRRASVQPSQITIGVTTTTTTRRRTSGTACVAGGVTTRQQRKRLSDESHHGPETPESKKPTACFPRPQTPRNRDDRRRSQQPTPSNPAERRQSLAFSILNTPKQIGSSLLRRAVARKNQSKSSPRVGARRSPR
ncbi:Nuclear mitotic apparatus protein 1, partial [Cuculus canorus]